MNKKFYHYGRRLSALFLFCFSIVSFIPNASAQECGSVTLGDDVSICNGYEATLEPTADFTFSGNADKVVSQTGKILRPLPLVVPSELREGSTLW